MELHEIGIFGYWGGQISRRKRDLFFTPPDLSFKQVPGLAQGSQRFPRIKFHDFSMIFHDPFMFFHDQRDTKMIVSSKSFYFSYCGFHITPFSNTLSTKQETKSNFIIVLGMCAHSAKFFWIMRVQLKKKFHDVSIEIF